MAGSGVAAACYPAGITRSRSPCPASQCETSQFPFGNGPQKQPTQCTGSHSLRTDFRFSCSRGTLHCANSAPGFQRYFAWSRKKNAETICRIVASTRSACSGQAGRLSYDISPVVFCRHKQRFFTQAHAKGTINAEMHDPSAQTQTNGPPLFALAIGTASKG